LSNSLAHDAVKEHLLGRGLEQFPHAVLMSGPAGVGKGEFAGQLVALLLCEAVTATLDACGECSACRWLAAGNHPDFRRVAPGGEGEERESQGASAATNQADSPAVAEASGGSDKAKKRSVPLIKIDQIRELQDFVFMGSHRHGRRVILITQAEAMNAPAANALLKILEEPPPNVHFVLVSSKASGLLPTIRSRCRLVTFGRPTSERAIAWLAEAGLGKEGAAYLDLAGGAPMRVAQWKAESQLAPLGTLIDSLVTPPADPLVLAARWDQLLKSGGSESTFRMEHLVEGVQRWLFDLTQEALAGRVRYHRGWPRPRLGTPPSPVALIAGWNELLRFRRAARHPLNQLLFLEDLATHTLRALKSPGAPAS